MSANGIDSVQKTQINKPPPPPKKEIVEKKNPEAVKQPEVQAAPKEVKAKPEEVKKDETKAEDKKPPESEVGKNIDIAV